MDSVYYCIDDLVKRQNQNHDFQFRNIRWYDGQHKSSDRLPPDDAIKDADVLIIPTESEFVNHIKGRLSNIMFGRGWTLTRNIVDTIKKYPKKRLIILITSDKADTIELFKERTFEGCKNLTFAQIDEGDFDGNLHHLKYHFISDWLTDVDGDHMPEYYEKEYDFVYWGTSKKMKWDFKSELFPISVKDWYDKETGKLVATAIEKVGMEGVVHIEESRTGETYLETVEGLQFERGYKSPYFVTDNNSMTAVLESPLILITEHKLTKVKELLPVLEAVSAQAKSLLIIAEDIDQEALATLVVNKMRGTMQVCAVKAPDFGDKRKLILEDIAITTGGQVFSREKGMKLDKFSWEWFGEARTVTVEKEQTTIVDGKGEVEVIEKRIEELQTQIDKSNTPFEVEKLQERLAKFVGGVAIIHVGGNTETEMKEKKDRVDDALHATKAAIEEGIVPGGGTALLYASSGLEGKTTGAQIVIQSCAKPFNQILVNAGWDEVDGRIMADNLVNSGNDTWTGFDIKTGKKTNMKKAGIIDPTKVARLALENAASIAGTVLLTECTVVDEPQDDDKKPQIDPSMMGMM